MFITLWKPAAAIGAASIAMMWAALAPSPTHATPDLKSVFQMLDRNHDGAITFGEFVNDASDPAVQKMHHAHMSETGVANQMAKVHAEMMANPHAKPSQPALRKHFDELDANSDGKVSFAEFKQMHTSLMGSLGH